MFDIANQVSASPQGTATGHSEAFSIGSPQEQTGTVQENKSNDKTPETTETRGKRSIPSM